MARMRIDNKEIRDADVFQTIVEHFPDIIHSVDSDGNILFTNKKASDLLGYSRDELLAMNIRDLYAEEILDKVEKGFAQLKKNGEKNITESKLKDSKGQVIPVEVRSFSIYDDDGRFLRTFSIIRDIRELKELHKRLIHAGRLAAIGEMASGIAHDIKNPMNVLMLANEIAMSELERGKELKSKCVEKLKKQLDHMTKASKMIVKLSEQLTNFSRGITENHEKVDLYQVINDAIFMTQNKIAKSGVTIKNDVSDNRYFSRGAPNQLVQVFVNLISNACDAMSRKARGSLTLIISPFRENGTKYWRCDVSDTGVGIPKEILENIFQSFFTTKEREGGAGLGLSISRGIIRNHEGDIKVCYEQGGGTTFSVYLPSFEL